MREAVGEKAARYGHSPTAFYTKQLLSTQTFINNYDLSSYRFRWRQRMSDCRKTRNRQARNGAHPSFP